MKNKQELEDILKYVEGCSGRSLTVNSQEREVTYLRAVYANLALKFTFATLSEIGFMINKDHSTIIYYRQKIINDAFIEHKYRKIYEDYVILNKGVGEKIEDLYEEIYKLRNTYKENNELKLKLKNLSSKTELTDVEKTYRNLTEEQQKIYDIRVTPILNSFEWTT